jgi:pimeloyl-ACP methyl ester carboxylesterase
MVTEKPQAKKSRSVLWFIAILSLVILSILSSKNSKVSAQEPGPEVNLTPIPTQPNPVTANEDMVEGLSTEQEDTISNLSTTSWQQQSPPSSPSARAEMGFIYDSGRNVIVATGGSYGNMRFAETWEYDGTTWTRKFPAQSPVGRDRPAIAYDPIRRVTVLFGGSTPGDGTFYNDTWEYDGNTWVQRFPLNPPSPRNGAKMAYDPIRGRMLLFGGYRFQGQMIFFDETWEYDGAQWVQRFPVNRPEPRETVGLAYDTSRGVMVLFGGGRIAGSIVFNDTWEWDGNNWIRRTLPTSPPARWAHGMTYDQGRNRVILFGGLTGTTNAFNDTWEYDGNSWTRIVTSSSPPVRWDHGIVYDAARDTTVLFGGMYYQFGFGWRNDTWKYTAPQPPPTRPVVLLPGFAGSNLRSRVAPGCIGFDLEVWLALSALLADPWDEHLRRLELQSDGYSPANNCIATIEPTSILNKVGLMDFYETLYINLVDYGYKVELCPYDWRRFLNGQRLYDLPQRVDECVESAKVKYGTTQVDIVAHSTGGLAARQYVLSSPARAAKVHTIVSLGTPYLGTLKTFTMLRYGRTLMPFLQEKSIDDNRVKGIARNSPSFYQLLPSERFFGRYTHGYFFSDGRLYMDYDSMRGFLETNFNKTLVEAAHNFHSSGFIDDWRNDNLNVNYYIFVGTGVDTPRFVSEQTIREWGKPPLLRYYVQNLPGGGDGTVLEDSADLGGNLTGLAGDATICYFEGVKHDRLTSDPYVWIQLNKALRGFPLGIGLCPRQGQLSTTSLVQTSETDDSRQMMLEGRGSVHVWDEQGRHTGPVPNGLLENNIPLVTYEAGEENTSVGLPPLSTYTITVQMEDSSPLKIRFLTIAPAETPEDAAAQTVIFQDVPAAVGGQATIVYNPLADPTTYRLKVDLDGNGATDMTLLPTYILNRQQSADREPPHTSIQIQGQKDSRGSFTGPVVVTLQATDPGSGIHQIEYSLDGGQSGQAYTGPFTVIAEEVPVLYAQATDRAGNTEYPWAESRLRLFDLYLPLIVK